MSDGQLDYLEDETDGLLGRNVVHHDPRNRRFPARGVLFAEDAPVKRTLWWTRDVFDQGRESSCTAQAAAGVLATSPNRLVLQRTNLTAYDESTERYALYREAQKHDPWPDENYEGSSTDAPFKVLALRGQIAEWRWCFGLADVLRTLTYHGPVAVGTVWTDAMFEPDSHAYIHAEGDVIGGHAYRLIGVDPATKSVVGVNSWGRSYGSAGRFKMSWITLDHLLSQSGEACTVML